MISRVFAGKKFSLSSTYLLLLSSLIAAPSFTECFTVLGVGLVAIRSVADLVYQVFRYIPQTKRAIRIEGNGYFLHVIIALCMFYVYLSKLSALNPDNNYYQRYNSKKPFFCWFLVDFTTCETFRFV